MDQEEQAGRPEQELIGRACPHETPQGKPCGVFAGGCCILLALVFATLTDADERHA
ncbi:hypothetical protein [Piscinibacter sp. HJYY11]|uniref:hypothetical protein n=1 Tax=Piscinibacter sp. HJYY11 TaxID=2801333 RepID=UPI003857D647